MTNFNRTTKQLIETAKHGRIGVRNFEKALPRIACQLRADSHSECFPHWGMSLNWDELENERIVDPKLLSTIGRLAQFPIRKKQTYHAGLIHTYGYLLSTLKTRFGYKRERWISGVIESGFDITPGTFSARPQHGTLFQNATYFLANIAFENGAPAACPTPDLLSVAFNRLKITRIQEIITRRSTVIQLFTDIVKLNHTTESAHALLVYSYRLGKREKLVTCFTIDQTMEQALLQHARENTEPIRPRFNLFLKGVPELGVAGTRKILRR